MRSLRFGLICSVLFALSSPILGHTQVGNIGEHTLTPFGSFSGSDIDHIDLSSGALSMRIPIYAVPLKNSKLKASFSLVVDGSMRFSPTASCDPTGSGCTYQYTIVNGTGPGANLVLDQGFGISYGVTFENFTEMQGWGMGDIPIIVPMQDTVAAYYVTDAAGGRHNLVFDSGLPGRICTSLSDRD